VPPQHQVSRIGPTVVVEGEIRADQDLIVEGLVKGILVVNGDVTLEKSARLEANIQARNLTIHGYLLGDVLVDDKVQIQPTGTMIGQLIAARLTVADGARFKGPILMGPNALEAAKKSAGSARQPQQPAPPEPPSSASANLEEKLLEEQLERELAASRPSETPGAAKPETSAAEAAPQTEPPAAVAAEEENPPFNAAEDEETAETTALASSDKKPGRRKGR
jgi:cytoskeletal protein CcmA (bactofilin family)